MEKKNFEYEGTILTGILEFFGGIKKNLTFEGFCRYIDEGLEPAIAAVGAAAGTAGAVAVGAADAFLKGTWQDTGGEVVGIGGIPFDVEGNALLPPEEHHYNHPDWEIYWGDGQLA